MTTTMTTASIVERSVTVDQERQAYRVPLGTSQGDTFLVPFAIIEEELGAFVPWLQTKGVVCVSEAAEGTLARYQYWREVFGQVRAQCDPRQLRKAEEGRLPLSLYRVIQSMLTADKEDVAHD